MINSIRYQPLIERDDETHEYAPLFVTTDEDAVRKAHRCYLEEFVNGYYQLRAGKAGFPQLTIRRSMYAMSMIC